MTNLMTISMAAVYIGSCMAAFYMGRQTLTVKDIQRMIRKQNEEIAQLEELSKALKAYADTLEQSDKAEEELKRETIRCER